MATAEKTKDHGAIREWIEVRGGTHRVWQVSIYCEWTSGEKEESFDELNWSKFVEVFDREGLKFLYDPDAKSRFNEFISGDDNQG